MSTATKIIPVTDDYDTGPFFDGARQGKLLVRACKDCESGIHPPVARCPFCGSWNTAWREASGKGRLHTWTVVKREVHPAYPVPYTIVSVELDDVRRVRLIGRIPGEPELRHGMEMEAFLEAHEEDVVLPNWRPVA